MSLQALPCGEEEIAVGQKLKGWKAKARNISR